MTIFRAPAKHSELFKPLLASVEARTQVRVKPYTNLTAATQAIDGFREALQSSVDDLQASVKSYDIMLRKHRNGLSRISQLPLEILTRIFWIHLQSEPPLYRKDARAKLGSVCSLWRVAVVSSPQLWTSVSGHDGIATLFKALQLSKQHRLDVHYFTESSALCFGGLRRRDRKRPIILSDAFFACVLPQLSRWRAARLDVKTRAELSGLENPAPNIEELELVGFSSFDDVEIYLFADNAPQLRSLKLSDIKLDWGLNIFRNLDTLQLVFDEIPIVPIFTFLDTAQHLRLLVLDGVDNPEDLPRDEKPIPLPELTKVKLNRVTPELPSSFFKRYSMPKWQAAEFRCNGYCLDEHGGFGLPSTLPIEDLEITQFVPHAVVDGNCHLEICGERAMIEMEYTTDKGVKTFALECGHLNVYSALEWMAEKFDGIHHFCNTLNITDRRDIIDFPPWPLFLSDLPIKRISICDVRTQWLREFLRILSSEWPTGPEEDEALWVFPCLRSLDIDAQRLEEEDLLNMVKQRYRAIHVTCNDPVALSDGWPRGLPQHFETLEITTASMSGTTVKSILDVIGEEFCAFRLSSKISDVREAYEDGE